MKKRTFTKEHRANISRACIGRKTWSKGKKMPLDSLRKNMKSHIRFDVSIEYLRQFANIDKLKTLNRCITNRSGRFNVDTDWYISYIDKFYNDAQFNAIYNKWIDSDRPLYLRPSIDHIVPKAKGGTNEIDNIQFLTWFENRCKNDMTQEEWNKIKLNLKDYLI